MEAEVVASTVEAVAAFMGAADPAAGSTAVDMAGADFMAAVSMEAVDVTATAHPEAALMAVAATVAARREAGSMAAASEGAPLRMVSAPERRGDAR